MAAITTIEEKRVRIDEQQDQIHKCVYLSVKHSVLIKKKKKTWNWLGRQCCFPVVSSTLQKARLLKHTNIRIFEGSKSYDLFSNSEPNTCGKDFND